LFIQQAGALASCQRSRVLNSEMGWRFDADGVRQSIASCGRGRTRGSSGFSGDPIPPPGPGRITGSEASVRCCVQGSPFMPGASSRGPEVFQPVFGPQGRSGEVGDDAAAGGPRRRRPCKHSGLRIRMLLSKLPSAPSRNREPQWRAAATGFDSHQRWQARRFRGAVIERPRPAGPQRSQAGAGAELRPITRGEMVQLRVALQPHQMRALGWVPATQSRSQVIATQQIRRSFHVLGTLFGTAHRASGGAASASASPWLIHKSFFVNAS